jgi:CxxC-x17-CxxC domain-containing protein
MFFKEKHFEHERKHCMKCTTKRASRRARVETSVVCAACGSATIVPFLPRGNRPVLCRSCFDAKTAQSISDRGTACP